MTVTRLNIPLRKFPHAVEAPLYASAGAAGADLFAAIAEDAPIELSPGAYCAVPTGIAIALPEGWEGQVRPRSGLARRNGIGLVNSIGTIDCDYRGEIAALLINHGRESFKITRGMRIAQLVICPVAIASWVETDSLDETERADRGFGSTGAVGGSSHGQAGGGEW